MQTIVRMVVLLLAVSTCASQTKQKTDPQLIAWYEQANAYYSAVQSGKESKPSSDEWAQFVALMSCASERLGTVNGNPYGGVKGPMDNFVYRTEEVRIGFTGKSGTHDIWSKTITIDVASLSARVSAELTTDTRYSPPEAVLKIVVREPGSEPATYFVHDFKQATVTVNTPTQAQWLNTIRSVRRGVYKWRKPGRPPSC